MSRIGKQPIAVPQGVEVKMEGSVISVKGPKGQLQRTLNPEMKVTVENGQILVARPSDEKNHRALHGLTRTLIANMVQGVTNGFEKSLDIVGVGYRAAKQGKKLVLTIGYSHPIEIEPEAGLEIEVPNPNKIVVKGADKEKVGQLAANIRFVRPPEPYKGKGIKYTDERIRMKVGKAGTKKK
ncbi:MAG TPA: 50S ribosomal protein L6 [Peptococcaceae bacterium]|jgi:large subunit ribosomal protein L6|nr:50S ribosomal protein L6 [Clostridia bacterium]HOB82160.1 50S ribosomal protein L6 [Peptococcaceae bacterium]HPZ71792.1 50S ribosomal protein L6 [Peptococcaceae bacterium]HQD53983.1 50S ribosomal protein L6 [Peptococcaceae bacterium]